MESLQQVALLTAVPRRGGATVARGRGMLSGGVPAARRGNVAEGRSGRRPVLGGDRGGGPPPPLARSFASSFFSTRRCPVAPPFFPPLPRRSCVAAPPLRRTGMIATTAVASCRRHGPPPNVHSIQKKIHPSDQHNPLPGGPCEDKKWVAAASRTVQHRATPRPPRGSGGTPQTPRRRRPVTSAPRDKAAAPGAAPVCVAAAAGHTPRSGLPPM